jgi:hypothetical protein
MQSGSVNQDELRIIAMNNAADRMSSCLRFARGDGNLLAN